MMKKAPMLGLMAIAFALAAPRAFANQDEVHFGNNIHVAPGTSVHDAVCFFCNVKVEGEVKGDVVVFFGSVHLAGNADHDVVNFFGGVSVEDNVNIGQDLVSFFGLIRLGENVSVGKDMVAMFGGVHAPGTVTVGGDRVSFPGWLFFGPLFIVVMVLFLVVREYRSYRRRLEMRGYPFPPR
jgi:hypothetical protein